LEVKKIILDTNAYSRLLVGDEKVLDALSEAETVYMSIFVLGELFAGFCGGNKERKNRETLRRFLQQPAVKILHAGLETAEIFGQLKNTLKISGTLLPINDVWIAAQAIETGAVIVTFDLHFQHVPGLRVWFNLVQPKPKPPHRSR
jgi:tRNA(fMet)-specific endonuclease VapC